jgi:hypothetical protein
VNKKRYIITAIVLIAVLMIGLQSCIFIPQGIDVEAYFTEIEYVTYVIDASQEKGYTLSEPKNYSVADFVDGNEENVPLEHYFYFMLKVKDSEISVKSVSFIVQAEADITLKFAPYKGTTTDIDMTTVDVKRGKKTIATIAFDVPLKTDERISIYLVNLFEVGTVQYSIDSILIDAKAQ